MNVGWVGLGKLGLPAALALAYYGGHEVHGYDLSDIPRKITYGQEPQPSEEGIGKLLDAHPRQLHIRDSVAEVAADCELVIIAVQTPHAPEYGGDIPAAGTAGHDFEYAYLAQAVRDVAAARKQLTIVVLSTVSPGTMNRVIRPLARGHKLLYSPAFISLGTTIADFTSPPFVLIGCDDPRDAEPLREMYEETITSPTSIPFMVMSFTSAEIAKMAYNMMGTLKITYMNWLAELCHEAGGDIDGVSEALALMPGNRYMQAGMPDGGPCRPRDLAVMSWLADRLELPSNPPHCLMEQREAHARWIADLAREYEKLTGWPVAILGKTYKPGVTYTDGSPALLLSHFLGGKVAQYDPLLHGWSGQPFSYPVVAVVAVRHPQFAEIEFPRGSVVIDPFGYIADQEGVTVVRIGRP